MNLLIWLEGDAWMRLEVDDVLAYMSEDKNIYALEAA